jgi:branched-chain amino acid transport system ATP-binding protein
LLSIENLSVAYGNLQTVWDITFNAQEKELVVLIGSNGAGKSTILKTISGLLHPLSGTIAFFGQRIDHMFPDRIVSLGITHVPEGRRLFPEMTVLENLEMGAYPRAKRKIKNESLGNVFKYFPVTEKMKDRLAGTLSGGEQQMLAIGRGLMSKPKLLMLDEPSLGLAPMIVVELFDIIQRIHGEGVSILLVEQNIRHSLKLADRGYVLDSGKIIMTGEGKELLGNEQIKKAYLAA